MKNKLGLFIVLSILLPSARLIAQTTDDVFNGNVLQEVRLTINPRDLAELRQDYLGNNYYACDFHWIYNGRDVYEPQVAVRSRGAGSRSPIKPSLKVEFNRYESRNTFLGLKTLVLRGDTQDASMMHERVAMEFFRKMGIPATRESHARLYINGQYGGLYTLVEEIDQSFLFRNFGEDGGFLYNYQYTDPWIFQVRGKTEADYSPVPLKPETHLADPDATPIVAMVDAVNNASDAQFKTAVSQYIDLHNFVREIAAENFISEQDGIIGNYGLNNFYLYRLQNQLQSIFIPWDKSNAFWSLNWPIMHNVTTDVLSVRALALPDILAEYLDYLRQAAAIAGGAGGWLEQEITREYQQIRQAAYDDPNKLCDPGATGNLRPCTNDQFESEYQFMISFARQRAADVLAQLAGK